ncbi:MAG: hypothetical protein O7G85_00695 [Planctomycetota bacterium]|nr:hypothetical protein [Planctomycetota bacterium]
MRRRVRRLLFQFIVLLVVVTVLSALVLWGVQSNSGIALVPFAAMLAGYGLGILLIIVVVLLFRERRIFRRIPAQDGLVCPTCLRIMNRKSDDPPLANCPRCKVTYEVPSLVDKWHAYPTEHTPWQSATQNGEDIGRERLPAQHRLMRRHPAALISIYALMGLLMSSASLIGSGNWIARLTDCLIFMLLYLGMGCIVIGYGWRVGTDYFCLRCGYQRTEGAGIQCPECGQIWSEKCGTVRGRRLRSPVLMTLGVTLSLLMLLDFVGRFTIDGFHYRLVPTSSLITDLCDKGNSSTNEQWDEIARRSLSVVLADELALGLLKQKTQGREKDYQADQWLAAQIDAQSLSPAVLDAVHRQLYAFDTLQVDESMQRWWLDLEIRFRQDDVLAFNTAGDVFLIVDGIYIDGDQKPFAVSDGYHNPIMSEIRLIEMYDPATGRSAHEKLGSLTPGAHSLRFEGLYVFAAPSIALSIVDRDDEGMPIFPRGVLYSRPIRFEDTFTIPEPLAD